MSDRFELLSRNNSLSFAHHKEVASIKLIATAEDGKLYLSDEADMELIGKSNPDHPFR